MWAKLNSARDAVEEIIVNTQPMVIDNITHPKALFTVWSDAERLAVGIVPVTTTGTHLDTEYYTEANPSYAIAGDGASVVKTIGVIGTTKSLAAIKTIAKNRATSKASELLNGFGLVNSTQSYRKCCNSKCCYNFYGGNSHRSWDCL